MSDKQDPQTKEATVGAVVVGRPYSMGRGSRYISLSLSIHISVDAGDQNSMLRVKKIIEALKSLSKQEVES